MASMRCASLRRYRVRSTPLRATTIFDGSTPNSSAISVFEVLGNRDDRRRPPDPARDVLPQVGQVARLHGLGEARERDVVDVGERAGEQQGPVPEIREQVDAPAEEEVHPREPVVLQEPVPELCRAAGSSGRTTAALKFQRESRALVRVGDDEDDAVRPRERLVPRELFHHVIGGVPHAAEVAVHQRGGIDKEPCFSRHERRILDARPTFVKARRQGAAAAAERCRLPSARSGSSIRANPVAAR